MFDIGNAVVIGLVLAGLVALAKSLIYGTMQDRVIAVACLVVSFITVVLVAASDFAGEQVLLEHKLSSLNFASQLVIVLLLAGVASGTWQGFKALSHVGGESHL